MAVRNATIPTLIDVVNEQAPDGSLLHIAEVLQSADPIMEDIGWQRGNLDTGMRVGVRTKEADATFRRVNQGVLPSKGATRSVDETAALLESRGQVDRKLAVMSGDPAAYRKRQGVPHIQGMQREFTDTLLYGNEFANDTEFTGLITRFNELANPQVLDGGGTGNDLRSVLLVGWSDTTVSGIVSKNATSGLMHFDETTNLALAADGYPVGDPVEDGITPGATYLAYRDRWAWECGLMVEDPRFVVRGANINLDTIKYDPDADAGDLWLEGFMIDMVSRFGVGDPLNTTNAAFYVPRELESWLRKQAAYGKRTLAGWTEIGGRKIVSFDGIPVRRLDALNTSEAEVV